MSSARVTSLDKNEDTSHDKARNDELSVLLTNVGKKRSRDAFEALFAHFAPIIKGYCLSNYKFSLPAELADELVQEVMLKVWLKSPAFDSRKASANTWLFTVMRNCRIDMLRRQSKHNHISEPIGVEDIWDDSLDHQPVVRLEQARDKSRLAENINALPSEQRDVLNKMYLQGKTHSEIASDSGLPLGTVKSRVRIGLKKLQAALGSR